MDELADTVYFDPLWKAKPAAQTFEIALAEIIMNKTRVTGDVGASLQRAYKADSMKTELIKTNGWERDLFDIIDWDNFGVVFRKMKETDKIQLLTVRLDELGFHAVGFIGTLEGCPYVSCDTCLVHDDFRDGAFKAVCCRLIFPERVEVDSVC